MQSACFQQVQITNLLLIGLGGFIANIIIVTLRKIQEIQILFRFLGRNNFSSGTFSFIIILVTF